MANPDTEAKAGSVSKTIVLIDPLALRRAAVRAFLERWTQADDAVDLLDYAGEDALEAALVRQSAMVILSIGGQCLRDEELSALRDMLLPLAADLPIVIISDRMCQEEIAWAFERGLRGYLPTDTDPGLAMSALTFILNGGDFFPPSALMPSGMQQCGATDTVRRRSGSSLRHLEDEDEAGNGWEHHSPSHPTSFRPEPPISLEVTVLAGRAGR
ncbi:hypothetical protein [Mesorhizobium sp. CAU 1741]|uniref:hypothetical protein n=1 Tax=Mesorhizobium sp. CAU 1741 TaxID=3140366 RepID=UPI00325BEF22